MTDEIQQHQALIESLIRYDNVKDEQIIYLSQQMDRIRLRLTVLFVAVIILTVVVILNVI